MLEIDCTQAKPTSQMLDWTEIYRDFWSSKEAQIAGIK
jgi:hypothetical protein